MLKVSPGLLFTSSVFFFFHILIENLASQKEKAQVKKWKHPYKSELDSNKNEFPEDLLQYATKLSVRACIHVFVHTQMGLCASAHRSRQRLPAWVRNYVLV